MIDPDAVVTQLHDTLSRDPELGALLEQSLRKAGERARADLDPTLYDALSWPEDLAAYDEYLRGFQRWIPQQTDAKAWRTSSPHERHAQEVSDRLAHFFWLVDQPVGDSDRPAVEDRPEFRSWLTTFARTWGSFLDTPESFSRDILESFQQDAPEYTVEESLMADGEPNNPSGWLTFNQFFARELNAGLRPIAEPENPRTIVSPADCIYQHTYDIDEQSGIPATKVKNHQYGNVEQLLEGSDHAAAFAGGTFVHYMLPPSAYHRYHVPVSGVVQESFVVQGQVFMQVELEDGQFNSSDSSQSGYEFFQTRGVVTIDTSGPGDPGLGMVAVVPVGMSHVASVNLTARTDAHVAKGEEFGFFAFGGSDIIICFQAGVDLDVDTSTEPRRMGTVIARAEPSEVA